jgi:hypothetical protein
MRWCTLLVFITIPGLGDKKGYIHAFTRNTIPSAVPAGEKGDGGDVS